MESALNEAAIYAAYERSDSITRAHLIHAVLKTIHHVPPEVYPVSEEQRKKVAFHEAGHTAMLELVTPGSAAFATLLYSPRLRLLLRLCSLKPVAGTAGGYSGQTGGQGGL